MQSILQYRHLRRHVENQLSLGRQKAAALGHKPNANALASSTASQHGSGDRLLGNGSSELPGDRDEEDSITGDYHDHEGDEPPELHVSPIGESLGVHIRQLTREEGGDGEKKVFVVYYMGKDDVTDAHSWSWRKRMIATTIISVISAVVGFASAIDSAALTQAMEEFKVGEIVGSLATGKILLIVICIAYVTVQLG